tara:strand:+ start:93 stop:737 length:645 start_codon:yes stop_codon:yes gene_type:complete
MKKKEQLPEIIPVFPLSNFIIFPETTVPLNIFEPRYIQMIDDTMKNSRMIGMIQPKKNLKQENSDLYQIGCLGKITSFNETDDGRYLVVINGLSRFKILDEIENSKLYRECKVSFEEFKDDFVLNKDKDKLINLEDIFKNLKIFFEKKGLVLNLNELKNQSLDQTINALSMASPFSLEEKQALLETTNLDQRKKKLEEILKTYAIDEFNNTTVQ